MVWMLKKHDASIVKEIEQQRDRAAGIIAAACLEERLTELLQTAFEKHEDIQNQMFKGYGPLGSFRAKIDLGLLLGLYPEDMHKQLLLIKDVRNAFAHSSEPITFKTQRITDLCNNFPQLQKRPKNLLIKKEEITREFMDEYLVKDPHLTVTAFQISALFGTDTARNRFLAAIKYHLYMFSMILLMIKKKRAARNPELSNYWPWPLLGRSRPTLSKPPRIGDQKRKHISKRRSAG